MSYDIEFKVRVENTDLWVDIPMNDYINITWNVNDIIRQSTGLEWKNEEDNGRVADVIPFIIKGYNELITNPEKYRHLESPNGWGTVEGTRKFFKMIIDEWEALCSDHWTSPLKDYVHFWIM